MPLKEIGTRLDAYFFVVTFNHSFLIYRSPSLQWLINTKRLNPSLHRSYQIRALPDNEQKHVWPYNVSTIG